MTITKLLAVGVACVGLVFAGCAVDKTDEGSVPDVDITTEGELDAPNYDVTPADVDVGSTTTEVTVPTVDVNMPADTDTPPADNQ